MPNRTDIIPYRTETIARFAGLLYVGVIACGIGAELALRAPLIDHADPEGTAAAIAGHEGMWRAALALDLVMATFDVALAVLLFALFRPVDALLSGLAMALRLVQMAVVAAHLPLLSAAIGVPDPLPAIERHAAGYDLGLWFFGVNGLVTATLLWRGGGPRLLAGLIAAAGLVYLAGSLTRFVAPDLNTLIQPAYAVPLLAELGFALWLSLGARGLRPAA